MLRIGPRRPALDAIARRAAPLLCGLGLSGCSRSQPPELFLNEIYALGPGDDWIEFYNASSQPMDIGGYHLYDESTEHYTVPAGTIILAGGFAVVTCTGNTGSGARFGLSARGETLILRDPIGHRIDRVRYPALDRGKSFGRLPDGAGELVVLPRPTRGETNGPTPVPPARGPGAH